MSLKTSPKNKILYSTKRGDTIIEVMFAFAIFCLIAIISIAMMNAGVSRAEGSLELVTARNELNAQAEVLRFIHSSYISEMTLPRKDQLTPQEQKTQPYQQYDALWKVIAENAISESERKIEYPLPSCKDVYEGGAGNNLLAKNHAFVINGRAIASSAINNSAAAYVSATSGVSAQRFIQAPLAARIVYQRGGASSNSTGSDEGITEADLYTQVRSVEGIWVVAVKGGIKNNNTPSFYDFYIQTCWYPPNSTAPTSLDTVIRLYNPEGV